MVPKSEYTEKKTEVCPFLGLLDDPDAHMAFTSPLNACHGSKSSPTRVRVDHQNSHCLVANYPNCEVFLAGKEKSFPRALRNRIRAHQDYRPRQSGGGRRLIFLVLALIILGGGYWLFSGGVLSPPPPATPFPTRKPPATATEVRALVLQMVSPIDEGISTPDPTLTATLTPFPSLTITVSPTSTTTNTPTQTNTSIPSPTLTPTPTETPISAHALEMPIGNVQKYLIHRVISGDNLVALAASHETSIEAILAVNYTLTLPIMVDTIIVIPLGMPNPAVLPVFETYQVIDKEISVEDLAIALGTDPVLFKYFNGSEDGEILIQDDWMLVPRGRDED